MNIKLLDNAKKYVNKLLLPLENHYYHQFDHSLEVMERCIELAKQEKLNNSETEILAIAGLFHDTWFIIQYDDNEPIWAKIAHNYLKSILYPDDKIKIIEELIMATIPDYKKPKNILEKIIKDADLDNLWRDDFLHKTNDLKNEIESIKNIKLKYPEWYHASLDFIKKYEYYTNTQKNQRETKKIENTMKLKKMLEELENEI